MEFEHLNMFSYYYFIIGNKICKKIILKEFTCSVLIIGMFMGNVTKNAVKHTYKQSYFFTSQNNTIMLARNIASDPLLCEEATLLFQGCQSKSAH